MVDQAQKAKRSPGPYSAAGMTDSTPKLPAWVPIRRLHVGHRRNVLSHLLALSVEDRYLRFGSPTTDEQISRYVQGINFDQDELFGVFNRRLTLIALAHLAITPSDLGQTTHGQVSPSTAEFGVSVLASARGRGFGSRLFAWSVLHARNHDIKRLIIHSLSENKAMLAIARKAGATVVRDGPESQATLMLPEDDLLSHVWQLVGDAVGELDFRIKRQAQVIEGMVAGLSSVGTLSMPRDVLVSKPDIETDTQRPEVATASPPSQG
jgi:RimJ/RimL family protein N-acetyltransferase